MHTVNAEKMTSKERHAVISLSSIMSLRMIGLFMVLPIFTLYAGHLAGATPFLIGCAMGVYGLSQALLQIPFGILSDRIGRKPVIIMGLCLFAAGSLLAALAHSIWFMMIGRALQGAGAIGSTILAMMADLTREEQRTKSMAIAGITIGFSFSIAMLIGPVLTQWFSVSGLFLLAMLGGFAAIIILVMATPAAPARWHRDTEPELSAFLTILFTPELAKLNSGIFILHAIFTASFVVIPISLHQHLSLTSSQQWLIYLPTLLVAFIISLICIGLAERKQTVKFYFLNSIFALAVAESLLWLFPTSSVAIVLGLGLFFASFSLLEAFLPSLISRTAPATRKGTAMGLYSCAQFLGIFAGGVLGGWLYGTASLTSVYLLCIFLALCWLTIAYRMQPPRYLTTQMWRLLPPQEQLWASFSTKLQAIPGMIEVTFIAEESMAYLKMERHTTKHPDFIQLKEQLQSK